MQRIWIGLGSLAGFGAVVMAAVAAHGVSDAASVRIVGSGVQMEGWHALALLGVGLWAPRGGLLAHAAGVAFAVGLVLFCGAVYSLGVFGVSLGLAGADRRHAADARLAAAGGVRVARPMIGSAYLAAEGFEAPLAEELDRRGVTISDWHGRLALSPDPPVRAAWALDIWTEPREIEVTSVKAAADALRAMQRNWAAYGAGSSPADGADRRTAAAGEGPGVAVSGGGAGVASGGVDAAGAGPVARQPDQIQPVRQRRMPFRGGPYRAAEPSVSEAVGGAGAVWAVAGDGGDLSGSRGLARRVDVGAGDAGREGDGGGQGATRGDGRGDAGVTQRLDSAFGLAPEPVDWLFSDVIAYPDRLLALVRRWIDGGSGAAYRLHDQVPGANRSRLGGGLRRDPGRAGRAPVP